MKKQPYNIIKEVLVRKKSTAGALAADLGVHVNTVSKWCRNETQPSIPMLFRVGKLLEEKPGDLLVDPNFSLPKK